MLSRDQNIVFQPSGLSGSSGASPDHSERISLVLAASRTGIWTWDPNEGQLDLDERARGIWGLAADSAISAESFLDAVHVDDRDRLRRILSTPASSVKARDDDLEVRINRFDDGRERWIAVQARCSMTRAVASPRSSERFATSRIRSFTTSTCRCCSARSRIGRRTSSPSSKPWPGRRSRIA